MDTVPGRRCLFPFYCCYGKLPLFGKVELLRHLICPHYSLVKAWLLNVWDIYVASSVVQALPLRKTWVNSLQGRRGQAVLQADRQESGGLKLGFPAFLSMEIPPTGKRNDSAAHCSGGRGVYRALVENKYTEKSKSQREGKEVEKEKRKDEKALRPSSSCWECCCLFQFAFFRFWRKSSKVLGDKVKYLLQDNSNIKKHMLYCVITN